MLRLLIIVLTAAVSTAAFAQGSPPSGSAGKVSFETLDKNKDGKLSQEEAKLNATVAAAFTLADKSGDNVLSKAEFNAYFNRP